MHDFTDGRTKKDSNRILDLSDEALTIIRRRVNDCLRFYCKKISLDAKSSHKIRKTVL